MSLKQCTECSNEVSSKAKKCPHCGAPVKNGVNGWLIILGLFFILPLIGKIGASPHSSYVSNTIHNTTPSNTIQTEKPVLIENWRYSSFEDNMTGKKTYRASLDSSNTLHFSFPYEGAQNATLLLRTHPRYGKDVMLSIEKGQFLCNMYDGCSLLIRFDDSPPVTFNASEPADHDSTVLFIENYSGFVGKMMKAKKVRIQANYFREGSPILEFDVSNFDVKRYLPTK